MLFSDLVATSRQVAQTSGRLEKIALLAALLARVAPAEIEIATAFLCGVVRQAKLGVGYASVRAATTLLIGDSDRSASQAWSQYFWNRGLQLGPCEFGGGDV